MQNFSPLGNLIDSFLKQQANRAASNIVVGSSYAARSLEKGFKGLTNAQPQPQPVLPQNNTAQLAMSQLDNAERAVLVKELLNLPSTLQELINTLQPAKTTQQAQITAQLFQNINVEQLMQLMQANGKEALGKIMQLAGMLNKMGNIENKQLQELQFIVNACMPNANMSNTQFMKNLILLYLPWLPIGENNNFDIEFSTSEKQSGGGEEADDTITILIQTENFGNVKVLLVLEAANKVNIIVNCSKIFPKEELLKKLNESTKEFMLESKIAVNENETIQKSVIDKQQTVHMSGASVLNPYVLLMAHAAIRYVIEIDKSQSLVTKRKQETETK